MTGIIRVHAAGGREVLSWESVDVAAPGPGGLRVSQAALGINCIDVYHRTGLSAQALPFIPGVDGAGVVEDVGPGVTRCQRRDRVAYAAGPANRSTHAHGERLDPLHAPEPRALRRAFHLPTPPPSLETV